MSRLAKKPIAIPSKVQVEQAGNILTIKGGVGTLKHQVNDSVGVTIADNSLQVVRNQETQFAKAIQGTTYRIISNHIKGVLEGFTKKLQLHGVGYKAKATGKKLELNLGRSHLDTFSIPEGVKIETPSATEITVFGADKQLVAQVAANIRRLKEPEPYKGKGIRYFDEVISLKEAKSSKK
jgi:large subunit ribosomal protein L6